MAKKRKEQEPKPKQESTVFRITETHGLEAKDYLVTADYYEMDASNDSIIHLYKLEHDQVASFRHWVAIENLREAEAWGEKFEALAQCKHEQGDMFEPRIDGIPCAEWKARIDGIKQGIPD